jgi:hypothetical protein
LRRHGAFHRNGAIGSGHLGKALGHAIVVAI